LVPAKPPPTIITRSFCLSLMLSIIQTAARIA
jgi:hypothetical protein